MQKNRIAYKKRIIGHYTAISKARNVWLRAIQFCCIDNGF